jgi:putative nucleotidyltransferase with HDIG domain
VSRLLRTPWRSRSASRAVDSASLATGVALVRALAAFDADTAEHSATVALYARDVALQLGADADSAAVIQLGALVHDVGKLSLPVDLLLKADPLDDDEWALMRDHPEVGSDILRHIDFLDDAKVVVRHHHERWDGKGYPDGLSGEGIPVQARVFALADTLDAITTDRPYRQAASWAAARERIRAEAGTQFDPAIVAAYETVPDVAFASIRDGDA